jgi:rhodanese-related sulfurtransferase
VVDRGAIDVFCLGVGALDSDGVLELLESNGIVFASDERALVLHERSKLGGFASGRSTEVEDILIWFWIEDERGNHGCDALEIYMTLFGEVVLEEFIVGSVFDPKGVWNVFYTFKGNAFFAVDVHDCVIYCFKRVYSKRGQTLRCECFLDVREGLRAKLFGKPFEEGLGKIAGHNGKDIVHSSCMESLSPQDLKTRRDAGAVFTIIDLQAFEGYAHRHIPGAVHMEPLPTCGEECVRLLKDKDADIVLYGEFDELGKGFLVLEALRAAGYTKVSRLVGGMMGWMEAGYGVESGSES